MSYPSIFTCQGHPILYLVLLCVKKTIYLHNINYKKRLGATTQWLNTILICLGTCKDLHIRLVWFSLGLLTVAISFFNVRSTSSVVWLSNWQRSWHDSYANFTNKQVHRTEMMQDTIRERVTRSRIVARALAKRRILPTSLWWTDFCVRSITSATDVVAYINRAAKNVDMTLWWVSNGETRIDWYFTWIWLLKVSTNRAKMACCATMLSS
jgi:hypothetical protein